MLRISLSSLKKQIKKYLKDYGTLLIKLEKIRTQRDNIGNGESKIELTHLGITTLTRTTEVLTKVVGIMEVDSKNHMEPTITVRTSITIQTIIVSRTQLGTEMTGLVLPHNNQHSALISNTAKEINRK